MLGFRIEGPPPYNLLGNTKFIRTVDPIEAIGDSIAHYRMLCWFAGFWREAQSLSFSESNTATITASLRDVDGNPLIDGNLTNNVDVEVVELIVA